MAKKRVSLVLGSGGARGLAHIGIIECLEQNGYEIHSIAGSSMGALIGGIYAAGKLDAYSQWVRALQQIDVLRLVDFSFRRSGLIKGEKVIETLQELIGDRNIEELPISYTAVATNIENQKEVWLNQGSLFSAIRASIAIPTVFTPVQYQGKTLVDGGLVNPIPIAPTLRDDTDLTIAVNLSAKADPKHSQAEKQKQRASLAKNNESYRQKIAQFVDGLQQKLGRDDDEEELGIFEVISGSFETMQKLIARYQLAAYSPDIVIDIPINSCAFYEFYRAEEMIELGQQQACKTLEHYL
ncbi:MAG: patatin-like phospholipase family protein [Chromatiales bacterium]|nr:patatin-like phospholipase family protein [Chromatiales bacterium]